MWFSTFDPSGKGFMRSGIVDRAISKLLAAAIASTVLLTVAAAIGSAPELPNPGHTGMSRQQQIQLGFQSAAQVYKQMPVLPDSSPETQYVRQLGAKLVATIPPQYTWPYEFHVVAQKEINAFALPGGPMFINIGTITAADNEAELAGVMAHEMSHVYMQHSARQAGKAKKASIFAGLAEAAAGATLGGVGGQLAQEGIRFGAQGLMLKYSRGDEAQADAVGAIILWKAGYNPQALADFFKKLEQQGGGAGPQFLSDHPNPGNREAAIQKEIADWPPERYQTSSPAFAQAKQHALGVRAYSAQEIEQGAKSGQWTSLNARNGAVFQPPREIAITQPASARAEVSAAPVPLSIVLPSSRLVAANLGMLTITRPENWHVYTPRQKGDGVTIAPPAAVAGDEIGYGVVISGVAPQPGERLNLDQVTAALVLRFEGGGGSQVLASPKPLQVAGVQGRSVALQSASPFPDAAGRPQQERDWLVTVPTPNGAVIGLVFVAPQAQFNQFRPTFESMLGSLHF
jgi:Zn-dependent protease with chaperone function